MPRACRHQAAPGAAQLSTPSEQPPPPAGEDEGFFGGAAARVTTDVGLNRFVWDMRYPDAVRFPGMILWAGQTTGPRVVPGSYQVKLTVDGQTMTESFEVKSDPRLTTTASDYAKQLDLSHPYQFDPRPGSRLDKAANPNPSIFEGLRR